MARRTGPKGEKEDNMRKVWILLLLALMVSAASVVPAAAAKPNKPGPPAPPALGVEVETVDVTHRAPEVLPFYWVDGVGDLVGYRVTVTNAGDVVPTVSDSESRDTRLYLDSDLSDPGKGQYVFLSLSPYEVTTDDYGTIEDPGEELINEVTVTAGGTKKTVSIATEIHQFAACNAEFSLVQRRDYVMCRWTPDEPGFWSITVTPKPLPSSLSFGITLRDHVPGNWCVVPDEADGFVEGTGHASVRRPAEPIELHVYLPVDGLCLEGGMGGDFMGVGNSADFYMMVSASGAASGLIEWAWCNPAPPVLPTDPPEWCDGL
jgi:hypothetical protein